MSPDIFKDTTIKHIMNNNLDRRDFLKLAGAALGATALACGRLTNVLSPTPDQLPGFTPTPTPDSTPTPDLLPIANQMSFSEIEEMLSTCNSECINVKPEDVATFVFDTEKLAFFKGTDGIHRGVISQNNKWLPIYGSFDPKGEHALWIISTSEATPVAEDVGKISTRIVFDIDLLNSSQGPNDFVATYINPEGTSTFVRIPINSKPGKIAFANPVKFETPTPEATPIPEVHMTLEDWKKIFKETTFIGVVGNKEYTVDEALFPYSDLVTDSDIIRGLENSAGITILGKDGTIILPINKDKAADLIDSGYALAALVSKNRGSTVASDASLMVIVAGQAYKNSDGKSKIHIIFDEVEPWPNANGHPSQVGIKYIETFIEHDGTITAPYMDMPLHFIIGTGEEKVSLEGLGLEYNEYNWLDVCIKKAGAKAIYIYGW